MKTPKIVEMYEQYAKEQGFGPAELDPRTGLWRVLPPSPSWTECLDVSIQHYLGWSTKTDL